ncbi:hypothetical protein K493DRAFT_311930 [Basidiobolus meristosporus CBS 931.73]|uniref:Nudix hydrolase domain-containing protein n=1 Tax=Basidiobolus meristosporus CBS 931.73 TaxID=1314790 RepID=A0A1Y1YXY6_9FUNG|nr:hypothetical protein K493DRAFT_311930 [Basidiobolus meristosporus CBS 931.73]|eukprot:ORY02893.1 hypothetical protein K493DRAFT_311930 [Basidiobolus meristosporus CBS 931.73]
MSSFVNAHVFPGGNVDGNENLEEWLKPTKSPLYQQNGYNPSEDDFLKLKLCAIRETFEESGLLLAKTSNNQDKLHNVDELQRWRNLIYKDASEFIEICREQQIYPAVGDLVHFSNWITPINYPKRYDTHFFLTFVSFDLDGLQSTVIADGQESLHTVWYTPGEALSEFEKGDITLFPPQWYTLKELSRIKKISELKQSLSNHKRVIPFIPQFQKADPVSAQSFAVQDAQKLFSILPGDEAYSLPSVAISKPGNRHRLWVCKDKDSQRMTNIRMEKNCEVEIDESQEPLKSKM